MILDISTWQDNSSTPKHVNFSKAVEKGTVAVFVKASERFFKDADFEWNWKPARDAGLLRGAYHFLHWDVTGKQQADWFWSIIKNDPGEMPMVADFEMSTGASSLSRSILQEFLERLESLSGSIPMIYTSEGFWKQWGTKAMWAASYPLWLAQYTKADSPSVPLPWRTWTFWQYVVDSDGLEYGMESKGIDKDRFNGTLEDLRRFCNIQISYPLTNLEKLDIIWDNHPELHPRGG